MLVEHMAMLHFNGGLLALPENIRIYIIVRIL
jgi:hypothetical protein